MIPGNANPLLLASAAAAAAGADTAKSLRFDSGDSAKLTRTPSSAGNRKTWTYSVWLKRSKLSGYASILGTSNDNAGLRFDPSTNRLELFEYSGSYVWQLLTDQVFRDVSSWYHIVFALDTTQATAADRAKLYVNGTQVTQFNTSNYPAQNYQGPFNNNTEQSIGDDGAGHASHFDGYLANVYFIDGLALAPTSFGAFDDNGVWQSAEYSGTFGTNGFYLDFSDATSTTTIAEDSSGNNNDWTANNFSTTAGVGNDVLFDFPTNGSQSDEGNGGEVSGNYATLNPLVNSSYASLSDGNLKLTTPSSGRGTSFSTIAVSSGKFYCEIEFDTGSGASARIGVIRSDTDYTETSNFTGETNAIGYLSASGKIEEAGTTLSTQSTYSTGDIIGMALNMDDGEIEFFKNGVSQGTYNRSILDTGSYYFAVADSSNSASATFIANFGQRAFAYTAPSGFKALCTTNLTTATVPDGSDYFDTALYTGNGTSQTISGLGFSPDFVWVKERSSTSSHQLTNVISGVGKRLATDLAQAEYSNSQMVTALNSDGFSVGNHGGHNENGVTYVAWTWDAGSSTVSNSDGSITSNVRASQTAGFSIVEYTGNATNSTVGHGLNAAVKFIIIKLRDAASGWAVYHDAIGTSTNNYIELQSPSGAAQDNTAFQNTAPTSSVFSIGTKAAVNNNGDSHIAWCFAPVEGYSQFGEYIGNGSSDGTFVYTGFKVAFLLVKRSDSSTSWYIFDSARSTFNVVDDRLRPHTNAIESSGSAFNHDFLSNGFKMRTTEAELNNNGNSYIYAAFSENAFSLNGGLAR